MFPTDSTRARRIPPQHPPLHRRRYRHSNANTGKAPLVHRIWHANCFIIPERRSHNDAAANTHERYFLTMRSPKSPPFPLKCPPSNALRLTSGSDAPPPANGDSAARTPEVDHLEKIIGGYRLDRVRRLTKPSLKLRKLDFRTFTLLEYPN